MGVVGALVEARDVLGSGLRVVYVDCLGRTGYGVFSRCGIH